jgi:hypothetical protein
MSKCLSCGAKTENRAMYCVPCLVASVNGEYKGTSLEGMVRQLHPEYFRGISGEAAS